MEITDLKKYGALMKELGLSAFEVSENGKTFRMEKNYGAKQSPAAETPAPDAEEAETDTEGAYEIKSPMVGIFYASSAEDKEDFVKSGSQVRKGDTICIIEAMKLMNEIKAEEDGIIEKVHVKNGSPVEFGTVLFTYRRAK